MSDAESFRSLRDLFRYNGWANARVFDYCRNLDASLLGEAAPGTNGSLEETLKHLIGVEAAFLTMVQGHALESRGSVESFMAHDLAWFADQVAPLTDGFLAILANPSDGIFDREIKVPWFSFRVTAHDGLLQVLSHSAQHRAQVFSVLGSKGHDVPGLDYARMVGEAQKPG